MENTAYSAPPEEVAHATVRAARLGVSRSRYVRAGLALAAAASDAEILDAVEALPARRRETWTHPLGRIDRDEEAAAAG